MLEALSQTDAVFLVVIGCGGLFVFVASVYACYSIWRLRLILFKVRRDIRRISATHLVDHFQNLQALLALQHVLEMTRPLPAMRGWVASPDVLLLLAQHTRKLKPNVIVECGSGVSTLVLARCCELNGSGHVYSLDHESAFVQRTSEILEEFGLSAWATVYNAPLRQYRIDRQTFNWYSLDNLSQKVLIDLLFIDGPPELLGPMIRYPAGPLLLPRLRPGGFVFVDDMARKNEERMVTRWMKSFPYLIRRDWHCEKGCCSLYRVDQEKKTGSQNAKD